MPASPLVAATDPPEAVTDSERTLSTKAWLGAWSAVSADWVLLDCVPRDDGVHHLLACGPQTAIAVRLDREASLIVMRSHPIPIHDMRRVPLSELMP